MKLLDKWADKLSKITNYIYELDNGMKVVYSHNPKSVDFDFSIIIRGGAYFEKQLGMPRGVSHLLEHIIFGNANRIFNSYEEMVEYSYGTRFRPYFSYNAKTSVEFVYYYGHGHRKAAGRILKFLKSQIDFPEENVEKFINKEKAIIEGELQSLQSEEEDRGVQYRKFAYGEIYPEFIHTVIGNKESLHQITIEDVKKFKEESYVSDNIILAIQSDKKLNGTVTKELRDFNKFFPKKNCKLSTEIKDLTPKFKFKHFTDNYSQGVSTSVCYYYKSSHKIDYKKDRLIFFLFDLIRKVAYDNMREKKSLVYNISIDNSSMLFEHKDRGFSFDCTKEKLLEALDELYDVIDYKWKDFLFSASGEKWFENILSGYVYSRPPQFDSSYAEGIAMDILSNPENEFIKFDFTQAKKHAMKLTREDLAEYKNEFFKIIPAFWFVSPNKNEDEIYTIFKSSRFYNRYSKKV